MAQFIQNWRHKLFSGRALPPKKIDTPSEMLVFVEQTPGAIGFVPSIFPVESPRSKSWK